MFTHLSVIFCLHTPTLLFLLKTENKKNGALTLRFPFYLSTLTTLKPTFA